MRVQRILLSWPRIVVRNQRLERTRKVPSQAKAFTILAPLTKQLQSLIRGMKGFEVEDFGHMYALIVYCSNQSSYVRSSELRFSPSMKLNITANSPGDIGVALWVWARRCINYKLHRLCTDPKELWCLRLF